MRVSSLWEGTRALDAPVRDLPFREEPHEEPLDDAAPEVRRLARTVRAFLAHHVQPAGADHRLAADAGRSPSGLAPPDDADAAPGPVDRADSDGDGTMWAAARGQARFSAGGVQNAVRVAHRLFLGRQSLPARS